MEIQIKSNPLLGELKSELVQLDCKKAALKGCILILLTPFLCSIAALIGAVINDDLETKEKTLLIIGCILGILIFPLILFLFAKFGTSRWVKKQRREGILRIYENGFEKLELNKKPQTCLWSEIKKVNPMVLKTGVVDPEKFYKSPVDTKCFGVYEVYKNTGEKILLRRWYQGIEEIDPILSSYCKTLPVWDMEV